MRQMQLGGNGVGMVLAAAALLVNGPRLVQIFLAVDGIQLPPGAEAGMLGLTGIATGIVLSGGGMYLAHTLALPNLRQGFWRWILVFIWLLLLLFSVILIAPMLVYGVQHTGMIQVLNTPFLQWGWAIVAVLAVEVLAAGAMVANALEIEVAERSEDNVHTSVHPSVDRSAKEPARPARNSTPLPRTRTMLPDERSAHSVPAVQGERPSSPAPSFKEAISNTPPNNTNPVQASGSTSAARSTVAESIHPPQTVPGTGVRSIHLHERLANGSHGTHGTRTPATTNGETDRSMSASLSDRSTVWNESNELSQPPNDDMGTSVRVESKEEAMDALVQVCLARPQASYAEIGEQIGRGKSTVAGYVRELEEAGVLRREGNEIRVLAPLRLAAL